MIYTHTYLHNEHGSGRDFHVMTQFEIAEETKSLYHAYVTVCLENYVRKRSAWEYITDNHLCDNV